jgi:hypothetical protein
VNTVHNAIAAITAPSGKPALLYWAASPQRGGLP